MPYTETKSALAGISGVQILAKRLPPSIRIRVSCSLIVAGGLSGMAVVRALSFRDRLPRPRAGGNDLKSSACRTGPMLEPPYALSP